MEFVVINANVNQICAVTNEWSVCLTASKALILSLNRTGLFSEFFQAINAGYRVYFSAK